jgi:DNA-directed RNA polymerase specialized sigma24 family protein
VTASVSRPVRPEADSRRMSISTPVRTSTPPTAPGTPTVMQRLHGEWQWLNGSRRSLERVAGWGLAVGPVATLDDLLRHAGYGTVARGGHTDDHVLATLVALARHDDLAGRVVLQRMLPGVAAMARRRANSPELRTAVIDDLVTTAWTVIRTYPVEQRPDYVAANLLRRIEYEAFRKPTRRRATFTPRPPHVFDEIEATQPAPDAKREVDELLDAAARRGVAPDEIEFARRLARGDSTQAIAADLGVTDRTIRNRRANVTARLAQVAAVDAAA